MSFSWIETFGEQPSKIVSPKRGFQMSSPTSMREEDADSSKIAHRSVFAGCAQIPCI